MPSVATHPNETYEIQGGRIQTRSLEVHIVDHCNLRCRHCCSLSPVSEKALVSQEELRRLLRRAGTALQPQRLKLVGGEPLLHPKLIECLQIARESGIAKSVSLTTNGLLAKKAPPEIWHILDHITVSIYPTPGLPESTQEWITSVAESNQVQVNWKHQDQFVLMDRNELPTDDSETEQIYRDCWLRRRCHSLANGRFYTCTRPSHMHAVSGLESSPFQEDGVPIDDGGNLTEKIYQYLIQRKPLVSCQLCLGGSSRSEAHSQMSPQEVKTEQSMRRNLYRELANSHDSESHQSAV